MYADTFARFLMDKIGSKDVIFVSYFAECYGSPISASYRKLVDENHYDGTLENYALELGLYF